MDPKIRKRLRHRARRLAWLSVAVGSAMPLGAQPPADDQPRWFTVGLEDSYLKFDGEAEQQTIKSAGGGSSITTQRLYLAPALGVDLDGSVYHPNLFSYTVNAEPGYMWQQIGSTPGGSYHQDTVMQNYRASGTFLQTKPFSTTLFGSERHFVSNYDFFNQSVVDSQGYGATSGFREGPVPMTVAFNSSHDDSSALAQHTILDQQSLTFHAQNDRSVRSTTDLDYRYGQYDQQVDATGTSFHTVNTYHYVNVSDVERFGPDDRMSLNSMGTYNYLDDGLLPSQTGSLQSDFGLALTPRLHAGLGYNFVGYADSLSDSEFQMGRASLSHQLYESLSTSGDVHGALYHAGSGGSDLSSQSFGLMGSVNYTKHLSSWGQLTIGNTASWDDVSQDSSGGLVPVPNEVVVLSTVYMPLKQPNDADPVTVTTVGGILLTENLDYQLDRTSNPWGIRVLPSSTLVHSGDTVHVTYYVRANPTGGYQTFQNQFSVRLDLLDRLLSLHARYFTIQNFTNSPGFLLQNQDQYDVGADFSWKGIHLGAEYTDTESSLYSFRTKSLTEGYMLFSSWAGTFSIDLHQSWTDYSGTGINASYYDAIARFECRPRSSLTWSVEGGVQRQRGGDGLNQDMAVARALVSWKVGKLDTALGYSYESQSFSGEDRDRHFIFLRTLRKF